MALPDQAPAAKAPAAQQPPPVKRHTAHSRESVWGLRTALPRSMRAWLILPLPLIVVGVWIFLSSGEHPVVNGRFLPSPITVIRSILDLALNEHTLFSNIWASMFRIIVSFLLAAAVALPLGFLMGAFEPINRFMDPVMAPLRYMPISAFIPLSILWLGIGEGQKIGFLFLGVFVYLLPVVVTAVRSVPEELVQTALTLGATRWQVVRTILVPAAMPDIFDSFRVMNAISWTYVVLAEVVNSSAGGLGALIQLGNEHNKPQWIFVGIAIIGVIGLLTDVLIRSINGWLFSWREAQS
jgi:NitT/TauT family transport system permease protein